VWNEKKHMKCIVRIVCKFELRVAHSRSANRAESGQNRADSCGF